MDATHVVSTSNSLMIKTIQQVETMISISSMQNYVNPTKRIIIWKKQLSQTLESFDAPILYRPYTSPITECVIYIAGRTVEMNHPEARVLRKSEYQAACVGGLSKCMWYYIHHMCVLLYIQYNTHVYIFCVRIARSSPRHYILRGSFTCRCCECTYM